MSAAVERPLRILVVNWLDLDNPQSGGAEEHLHQIFGQIAARGHEVTVLVSGWAGCSPRARADGLDIHRAGSRYTFSLAAPLYFRRHLAARAFDVVVEDLNKVPAFCRYWTDGPVVLLAHHLFGRTAFQAGPLPVAAATWLMERTVPRVFFDAPAIAVSQSTKDDLVSRGLDPERIEVIPNGIELDRYTPAPAGGKADRPTLLFLGRLKKYKRVDLVLQAVARLVTSGLDVELQIGGDGDQLEALRAEAERLRLGDHVTFLGFVTDEEKVERLRRAWIHVLTSPKEGWGISNLEAAACGTPTVASDSPGLRESVVDGRTGLLVPHGDVDALTAALGELIGDHDRRAEMGRNARAFAEGFSWEASSKAVERALSRVVANTPRG